MVTMMESLEGRQMFSVASPESTTLAAPVAAIDASAATDDAASKRTPKLCTVCATGTHYPTVVLHAR